MQFCIVSTSRNKSIVILLWNRWWELSDVILIFPHPGHDVQYVSWTFALFCSLFCCGYLMSSHWIQVVANGFLDSVNVCLILIANDNSTSIFKPQLAYRASYYLWHYVCIVLIIWCFDTGVVEQQIIQIIREIYNAYLLCSHQLRHLPAAIYTPFLKSNRR